MFIQCRRPGRAVRLLLAEPHPFNGGRRLPVDVRDEGEAYALTADVPGLLPEDLEVTIEDGVVTLRVNGKPDRTEKGRWLVRERPTGQLFRSLRLSEPLDADRAQARLESGLLVLHLPKAGGGEAEAGPRQRRLMTVGPHPRVQWAAVVAHLSSLRRGSRCFRCGIRSVPGQLPL